MAFRGCSLKVFRRACLEGEAFIPTMNCSLPPRHDYDLDPESGTLGLLETKWLKVDLYWYV